MTEISVDDLIREYEMAKEDHLAATQAVHADSDWTDDQKLMASLAAALHNNRRVQIFCTLALVQRLEAPILFGPEGQPVSGLPQGH